MEGSLEIRLLPLIFKTFTSYFFEDRKLFCKQNPYPVFLPQVQNAELLIKQRNKRWKHIHVA